MSFISLNELARMDAGEARRLGGGKAMNLAALSHAGFQTPRAFVVSTSVFSREMQRVLAKASDLSDPKQVIAEMSFSESFMDELQAACDALGCSKFAIRSSATDEDAEEHSFAGLLESVIGVSRDACADAIKRVWASFYARERVMFPSQAALDGPIPSMAVLVQECIESEAAGVVFTRHPLEGPTSLLVNVTRGEGETVVSGKGGEAVSVNKSVVAASEDALTVSCEALSGEQLGRLCRTALCVEKALGAPQDIEFAFSQKGLFLLQTRAIVSGDPSQAPNNHLFSNVNVGEALAGVCTPLTWSVGMSFAQHGFETVFHAAGLSVPESYTFVTTFFGHIYLNVSQILSLCTQIPFIGRERFGRATGIAHLSDYVFDVDKLSRAKFVSQLPISVCRVLKNQRRVRESEAHALTFCQWRDRFMATQFETREGLRDAFDELWERFIECGDDMLAAAVSSVMNYFLVSSYVSRVSERDASEIETYLFCNLMNVKSAAPGIALQSMAQSMAQHAALKEAFLSADFSRPGSPASFLAGVRTIDGGAAFAESFSSFLASYGARANQEAELANPRWREDPRFLFQVMQGHLRAPSSASPSACDAQSVIEDFVEKLFAPNRAIFRRMLTKARDCTRQREVWRAYVVDALGAIRHFALSCAKLMVKTGTLSTDGDVFFLTLDEIHQWVNAPESLDDARLRVAFRRARHEAFLSAQSLPCTFTRHPNACRAEDPCQCGRQLRGLPASPGCVKAPVRVIRDLATDAASLQHGEIIVASSTDVGWTPLFLLASAILTEQGGPLSHAFVVAREYGVPAVVSIPNLLANVKTGDVVTVFASKGVVTLE